MTEPLHPNLHLTSEEKRLYYKLFQAADTTNLGVITGEVAVPFFEKTKLPPDTLGLIWQIADKENRGLLTPAGFSVVLRLIGHAQAGRPPTEELARQPGPLPWFEGLTDGPPPRPSTASPPPPAGGPVRVPALNLDDVNKFTSLFEKSETQNGLMSGEVAKQIFERARLPNEVLGRIWNLADTKQRGQLDLTEFIIAMHLLTSYKTGAMRGIPQALPPGLYEAASRRGPARHSTGSRPSDVPPVPPIPAQYTGNRTQSPLARQTFAAPLSAQTTGGDWLITPQEKAQFDNIFNTVDTGKTGVISGDQAVAFFSNAQLSDDVLAQIWDLADIDADGQLTRDEFAVAMYLVRQQRARKEPLPTTLPPALVPPSFRRQPAVARPPATPSSPPPASSPAPAPAPRSAAEDLFGLDAFTPSTQPSAAPTQVPQSTGSSNPPFPSPGSPSKASNQGSTTFKPFTPSSQFGQSLNPQLTGVTSATKSPPPPSDDLLGDNDPEESKKLTQETADLANLSNQIGTLSKEMQNVQSKRVSAEQEMVQTSQQKRDFEARLAEARAMYEKEVKDFKALEERLNASRAETKKLQQEYALLEGSRQDLQNQYDQVAAALAADQAENARLKEKIAEVNNIVNQLKPALEKARSEARHQKGLVAINKKQLATVEAERDRIQGEIDSLEKETQASTEASPPTPDVSSPTQSTSSQKTNPFFRRTGTDASEKPLSPQQTGNAQATFDSLFGPMAVSATSTPPPPTSFGKSPVTSGAPTPSVSPPPQVRSPPPAQPASHDAASTPTQNGQTQQRPGSGGSARDNVAPPADGTSATKDPSFDELFAGVAKDTGNGADDPFAGFRPRSADPHKTGDSEFPPIQELGDDSSDSEAPMGFDDNFTPGSPSSKGDHSKSGSIDASQLQAFPAPGSGTPSGPPPASTQEPSPPSYETSTGNKDSSEASRTMGGLLPERHDPTRAPDAPHSVESSTGAPVVAGEPQRKAGEPDFEKEFEGLNLAPAKEEDDSSDDEPERPSTASADYFSFDTPKPSASSPEPSKPAQTASADFFNFDSQVQESGTNAPAAPTSGNSAPTTQQHDWDALFAPLNKPGQENGDKSAEKADSRPPGWALTADAGEDDQTLQRLMSMGYPRDEALAALEKFDYNIEKAADYLTSRS